MLNDMGEKINVAELLKDCPKGMELDCTIFDDVYFDYIDDVSDIINCYIQDSTKKIGISFSKYGCYSSISKSKCVIFPKGKTTWEGFVPPCKFKDGDIIFTHSNCLKVGVGNSWISIFKEKRNGGVATYVDYAEDGSDYYSDLDGDKALLCMERDILRQRLATEEEKEKLFKAIKDNGYKWNEETKTLEKLFEPKFHKGDWVTDGINKCQIYFIDNTNYWYSDNCILGSIESVDKRYHLWTIDDAIDGNVLFHLDSASNGIFIFKEILQLGTIQKVICYCDYDSEDGFCLGENHTCCWADSKIIHPATEKQRNLLFQKMKEAGYKWNPETKTLEKLIEPKFKVGNRVKKNKDYISGIVTDVFNDSFKVTYESGGCSYVQFHCQDNWELVPNKFDITTLKAFDKVLVRDSDKDMWCASIFSHTWKDKYFCTGAWYNQCIPYEANKELLGTTNNPKGYGSN